jgi:hypothetical protein
VARDVDRVLLEHGERHDVQCPLVRRREYYMGGSSIAVSAQPVHGRDTPAIAGHEARELVFGNWRAQVVADAALVGQELGRYDRADGVAAQVIRPGAAAAITEESGYRVGTTWFQLATEHVPIAHPSSIRARPAADNDGSAHRRSQAA